MASINQILVDWTTINGSGKVSVFYSQASTPITDTRLDLGAFFLSVQAHLDNSVTWLIRTNGVTLDDATGTLVGSWTDATARNGVGAGGTEPVADATQALIRWRTGNIINGRFLQGRTFIPGLASSNEVAGNLAAGTRTAFNTAAATLAASSSGLSVWHRPVAGSGGSHTLISSGDAWSELAVLRRRRG